ncbi:NADH dehydrogenase [ubiquinone] iron-sulfur protein 6, mitochondrial [Leptopilina boulardi]|uniref:NADH dehydrogenase [ubiquinone] iron-sulfur protein 6, mitochondrial n=1 Tax=Leptopilina boulardi TaxID=63433 RepID=UPI0021F5CF7B|nr:NADH dehydrogenase [ubiquinone] iron-sulfur protein 6, mitochondrial [Leptopilina boulardi]
MATKRAICLVKDVNKLQSVINKSFLSVISREYSSNKPEDVVTHTGQKFDADDYRMVRFTGLEGKEINNKWAIKLIEDVPPMAREDRIVACDGGGGPLGHPKVYINLDKPGNHSCGYCGLRFYKEDHHH